MLDEMKFNFQNLSLNLENTFARDMVTNYTSYVEFAKFSPAEVLVICFSSV